MTMDLSSNGGWQLEGTLEPFFPLALYRRSQHVYTIEFKMTMAFAVVVETFCASSFRAVYL